MSNPPLKQPPSIGRTVHVRRLSGAPFANNQPVACAIITAVPYADPDFVNLKVFEDGEHNLWCQEVPHESRGIFEEYQGIVWFWPPRV